MCPQNPISQKKRILLSWSSGKDSAWCLQVLRNNPKYEIAGLLTTFNEAANRVAMHAVRRELVECQAFACGLPLWPVHLPWPCTNERYEELMAGACEKAISNGIEGIAGATWGGALAVSERRLKALVLMAGFSEFSTNTSAATMLGSPFKPQASQRPSSGTYVATSFPTFVLYRIEASFSREKLGRLPFDRSSLRILAGTGNNSFDSILVDFELIR